MKTENLTELSELELLKTLKKIKNNKRIDATIIGITVGISIYGAVKNGLEFFTFFPLFLAYIVVRNSKNIEILEQEIEKELRSRNLE